ncbi:MAG: copper amine oxidase N-terminal domain-containing protein [Eubacteriales bacterium]|jgi:hypothetical protein
MLLFKKCLKLIAVTIIPLLMVNVAASAYAPIKLKIDGGEIQTEAAPRIINGSIFAPVRSVAENLGAAVTWDQKENTVNITGNHGISNDYIYSYPLQLKGGELSLGSIGKYDSSFVLPVLAAINKYLAEKQLDSLSDNKAVLIRYELLDSAFTTGGAFWREDTAYEVGVRLYYSKFSLNTSPGVIKLVEEKNADGITICYRPDRPSAEKSWYEDTVFIVRPVGNTARVIEEHENGSESYRKVWIQGENNWYVDESATEVLKKVDLKEIPMPFDIPLPN